MVRVKNKNRIVLMTFLGIGAGLLIDNVTITTLFSGIILISILFPDKELTYKNKTSFLYFLILLILINLKVIGFTFIPQAEVLLNGNDSVIYWFSQGHYHAIRLLVSYPGYLLHQYFNITLNQGHSYYCLILFYATFYNITYLIYDFRKTYKKQFILGALIPFLILPFIMNGRILFSFFGFSIILRVFDEIEKIHKLRWKHFLFCVIGLMYAAVSSGTLVVAATYILFMLIVKYKKLIHIKAIWLLIGLPMAAALCIGGYYIYLMINKNLQYYGGGLSGVVHMMSHGAGKYVLDHFVITLFIIAFSIPLLVYTIQYLFHPSCIVKRRYNINCAIIISLIGLIFGYSTGMMAIIPATISICTIEKVYIRKENRKMITISPKGIHIL